MDTRFDGTEGRPGLLETGRRHGGPGSTARICLVGLGYVGLPLAVEFDAAGHRVTGFDLDEAKVGALARGIDTTGDLGDEAISSSDVGFSADPAAIEGADYVIIAVPTPIDENDQPDLGYVADAGRTVGRWMSPGTTVVLESTVYPGATREVLVPALAEASGLEPGEEFFVGYSPERLTPGDPRHGLRDVVKIVSGETDEVLEDVAALYETIVEAGVHRAPTIEVAEAAKIVENVQRDVNIALVNEFAMAFQRMADGLDWRAVLEAAGTKWNFHDYRPGLVGGHCIPVDPYFFTYQSKRAGFVPELTLAGRAVNESMPAHVATRTIKALNDHGKPLRGSRVLVLGLTYKPDVADTRMSKVASVVDGLREYDISVAGTDPYLDAATIREEFGIEPVPLGEFAGFDALLLATPHAAFRELDFASVASQMNESPVLVDVVASLDADRLAGSGLDYWSA